LAELFFSFHSSGAFESLPLESLDMAKETEKLNSNHKRRLSKSSLRSKIQNLGFKNMPEIDAHST
jgi:hypothetical protein